MKEFNDQLIERLEDALHESRNLKELKNGFKSQIIGLEKKIGEERQLRHEQELMLIKVEREL